MKFRFGRLVPLMQQVGDAGAAGAGSSPGTPPAGANGSTSAGDGAGQGSAAGAGNGQPAAKTFTQEEVNRIAAQAREDGRRSAAKAPESTEPKPNAPAASSAPAAPDVAQLAAQAVTQALQAAGLDPFSVAARQAGYSDAQVQIARASYDPTKAPDLGAWLKAWPSQVGMQINAQGAGAGAPTPAASTGAPPRKVEDMRDDQGLIDVFALSPEQVVAMGPQQIRAEFEKTLARARERSGAPPIPEALRRRK